MQGMLRSCWRVLRQFVLVSFCQPDLPHTRTCAYPSPCIDGYVTFYCFKNGTTFRALYERAAEENDKVDSDVIIQSLHLIHLSTMSLVLPMATIMHKGPH